MISANGKAVASVALPPGQRGESYGHCFHGFSHRFSHGPTLGGFLIDTVGWRWIFYLNLPVGIWGAYLAWESFWKKAKKTSRNIRRLSRSYLLMITCSLFIYAMNQLRVGWRV